MAFSGNLPAFLWLFLVSEQAERVEMPSNADEATAVDFMKFRRERNGFLDMVRLKMVVVVVVIVVVWFCLFYAVLNSV